MSHSLSLFKLPAIEDRTFQPNPYEAIRTIALVLDQIALPKLKIKLRGIHPLVTLYLVSNNQYERLLTEINKTKGKSAFPKIGEVTKILHRLFHDRKLLHSLHISQFAQIFQSLGLKCDDTVLIESSSSEIKRFNPTNHTSIESASVIFYNMLSKNTKATYTQPIVAPLTCEMLDRSSFSIDLDNVCYNTSRRDISLILAKNTPIFVDELMDAARQDNTLSPLDRKFIFRALLVSFWFASEGLNTPSLTTNPSDFLSIIANFIFERFPVAEYLDIYEKMIQKIPPELIKNFLTEQLWRYTLSASYENEAQRFYTNTNNRKIVELMWHRLLSQGPNLHFTSSKKDLFLNTIDTRILTEVAKAHPEFKSFSIKGFQITLQVLEILKTAGKRIILDGNAIF